MEDNNARPGPPGSAVGPRMYCKECGGQMKRIPGPPKPVEHITLHSVQDLVDLDFPWQSVAKFGLTCSDCGVKGIASRNQDDRTWELE